MVVIRLARGGAKKRPFFNIVVADSRLRRDGRFIERVGFYNPVASGARAAAARRLRPRRALDRPRRADVADGRAPGRAGEERRLSPAPGASRAVAREALPPWPDDALEVGRIGEAWGLKGGFRSCPMPSRPQALLAASRWHLKPAEGARRPGRAAALPADARDRQRARPRRRLVASSPASPTAPPPRRCAARASSSPRSQFPEPGADEFYWADLIGLAVVNREGRRARQRRRPARHRRRTASCASSRRAPSGDERADPVRLGLRRQRRSAGAPDRRRLGPRLLRPRLADHAHRRHHALPRAVLGAPRARRDAARLRAGPDRRASLAAAQLRRSAARAASTTGRTAAARGWCCSSSRSSAPWRRSAPPAPRPTPAPLVSFSPAGDAAAPGDGRRDFAAGAGRDPALRPLRRRRPALHRRPRRPRAQHRRLRALGRRAAGARPARRARPPAAGRPRRRRARTSRTAFRAGLLDCPHYSRPERLAERRRGPRRAAVRQPRRDRRLAARAVARADRRDGAPT